MPGEDDGQEKTEDATPRKRQKSREEGNVSKSQEINSVIVMLAAFLMLKLYGKTMFDTISQAARHIFINAGNIDITFGNFKMLYLFIISRLAIIALPVMIVIMIAGVLANYAQIGVLFTLKPLTPNFERLNFIAGAKKLISKRSLMELFKSIFKISIVTLIFYYIFKDEYENFLPLIYQSTGQIFVYAAEMTYEIGLKTSLALLILALLDFAFQRYQYEEDLKMSKQEIKEEMKDIEGDPQIKAKIRQIQREMAQNRMMQEVPDSDVVITNPTHIAVAVKYDPSVMNAPFVVAKGEGVIAHKIKEIALEHDIPIIENKLLARMINETTEIGDGIPESLFKAVAEVLAYVYQLKGKKM